MKNTIALASIVLALFAIALFVFNSPYPVSASAPSGLQASIATTSNPTVTSTAVLVFATSSCAARTISTSASPIMITFSDNQGKVPTGSFGTLQAASTTVTYDSGQFGCGAVKIYSFTSQVITVAEAR